MFVIKLENFMKSKEPLVSVILVNYNGKSFLKKCLISIFDNNYSNYEVIVVDNKSKDGSIDEVEKKFANEKNLMIIRNVKNSGPSGGANLAIINAKGKYIATLGYDTEVSKNWISEYVEFMEKNPEVGIAQGKLMRIDDKKRFAYAGDFLGPFGFLIERSRGKIDLGELDYVCEIFGVNSANIIFRKDIFDSIGGFDCNFFMYLEETDFCFRTHLFGKKIVFLPKAIVYHHDTTKVKEKKDFRENVRNYQGCRNYIWMLIKNLEFKNLIRILPLHVFCWMIIGMMLLFKGEYGRSLAIFKALGWHVFNFGKVWKSRNLVQKNIRKVKDSDFSYLFSKQKLSYYIGKGLAFVNSKPY